MKNKALVILLVAVFIKSIVWMLATPIFQAPDENVHFGMIQYIGENKRHPGPRNNRIISKELVAVGKIVKFNWMSSHPVWQGLEPGWRTKIKQIKPNLRSEFGAFKNQGGQKLPQLYFWLNFPLYRLFINQNFLIRFYALRTFSVILSLITVYLVFRLSQFVFSNRSLSLAVASLVAFQPMNSTIFSSITYDSLAVLIATFFLYLSLKFIKTRQGKYQVFALIVALFALTVKTQLIGLLLVWPLLLKKSQKKWLLVFTAGLVVLAGFKDYAEIVNQAFIWLQSGQVFNQISRYLAVNLKALLAEVFPWYWGVFGWLEKVMPLAVYRILKIIIGLSLIGLSKYFYLQIKKRSKSIEHRLIKFLIVFSLILAAVVFINDFFIFIRTDMRFGVQGRYLLPAISAHMILLVFGLTQLVAKSFHQLLVRLVIVFAVILNFIGLYSLYQFFGNVWS